MQQDTDEFYMGEALKEARKAFAADEVPVGSVIVYKGRVIARAHNQVEMLKDATAHAEIIAITQASAALGDWRLNEAVIYVTKEPCPMCAGAIINSRLERLVYGVADPQMGAAGSVLDLVRDTRLRRQIQVTAGVKEEDCRRILQEFFQQKRIKSNITSN